MSELLPNSIPDGQVVTNVTSSDQVTICDQLLPDMTRWQKVKGGWQATIPSVFHMDG